MLDMEISIKWNVCRVCLSEEHHRASGDAASFDLVTESSCSSNASGNTVRTKHIKIDSKMAQQIFECAGVKVTPDDSLPDKVCGKCSMLLRYAMHFISTCRNSDEYLQSVMRKTKSATSMLKLDKRRERVSELMDEIFNEESRLTPTALDASADVNDECEFINTSEDAAPVDTQEVIGDSACEKRRTTTQLGKLLQTTPKIFKVYTITGECVDAGEAPSRDNYGVEVKRVKSQESLARHVTIGDKEDFLTRKSSTDELVEHLTEEPDEYEDNEIEDMEERNDCRKKKLAKTTSECSIEDDGYMEDGDEEQIDALDISNEHNDYNTGEKKVDVGANPEAVADEAEHEIEFKNAVKSEKSTIQEMEAYFYIIDDLSIKQEFEPVTNAVDENKSIEIAVASDDEEARVDADADDTASIGLPDKIDTARSVASSVVALEEYLLEQSDAEDENTRCELDLKDENSKRGSEATIKISGRRFSPHTRKKVGDVYIYVCDVCGNQFTNRSLMNYHMRIHRNEKNYECELCFKRFTAACNLTAHMRIHTGEKPFECKYCQRRFTDRSTHVKHERVHTNEKPFQCNICGKAFALSTTLRTHEKVHTGEKPFKCIPCNKSFKLPHQLKSHLNTNQHKSIKSDQDMRN